MRPWLQLLEVGQPWHRPCPTGTIANPHVLVLGRTGRCSLRYSQGGGAARSTNANGTDSSGASVPAPSTHGAGPQRGGLASRWSLPSARAQSEGEATEHFFSCHVSSPRVLRSSRDYLSCITVSITHTDQLSIQEGS